MSESHAAAAILRSIIESAVDGIATSTMGTSDGISRRDRRG
jgi:hypothetical protein